MDDYDNHFLQLTAKALGACQLVEFALREYILDADELIRKRLGDAMPFKPDRNFHTFALGRLIHQFERCCNNSDLVSQLQRFTKDRNEIAHSTLARCRYPDGSFDQSAADSLRGKLTEIETRALSFCAEINDERNKFLGQLYFDNLDS